MTGISTRESEESPQREDEDVEGPHNGDRPVLLRLTRETAQNKRNTEKWFLTRW